VRAPHGEEQVGANPRRGAGVLGHLEGDGEMARRLLVRGEPERVVAGAAAGVDAHGGSPGIPLTGAALDLGGIALLGCGLAGCGIAVRRRRGAETHTSSRGVSGPRPTLFQPPSHPGRLSWI
jgi:hypothetical protein